MTDAPGWVTLTEGEEVVWRGHPVLYHYLGGIVIALVLFGLAGLALTLWPLTETVEAWIPAAVLAGLGLLVALRYLLAWWSIQYLVTTEEVYVKRGLVSRSVTNLRMERIQSTSFSQSFVGRLLSYGDVHIDTAGGDEVEIKFRNVSNPNDVVGYVSEWMGKSAGGNHMVV